MSKGCNFVFTKIESYCISSKHTDTNRRTRELTDCPEGEKVKKAGTTVQR